MQSYIHLGAKNILFTPFLIHAVLIQIVDTCPPAVMGKEYIFQATFVHEMEEPLEVVWLRSKTPISMCKPNMACFDYSDVKTSTSIVYLKDHLVQCSLTLRNVTRIEESNWSLKYLGLASLKRIQPLFTCALKTFELSALTLVNCTDKLEEGDMLYCMCISNNETGVEVDYSWFDKNGLILSNGSHLLSLVATRNNAGFECRGRTITGERTIPLKYDPLIFEKPDTIDCALNQNKNNMTMGCKVENVFPAAKCEFAVEGHVLFLSQSQDDVIYEHQASYSRPLFYNTHCFFDLSELLPVGLYNVAVAAYPNVSGSYEDRRYSITTSILVHRTNEIKQEQLKDMLIIYSYILVCFLCIILMGVFIKQRKSKFYYKCFIANRPTFSGSLNDAANQKLFQIEEHESKDLIEDLEIKKKIINV
ncbi:uncharacterized protein LOC106078201 [Biomphalaria glabrata]|uniref:Uncharacterized protein LOC106078201 n=1 Tax=Biomphalaria glabrata TaxID=6526 RepID=A0A9W2YVL4_BIOGL|nr:uncharacterized protein LOC106078201 [Biomphalaria glabrata]XP_055866817.1 uncharacterized protein LOC106078201 [Biomphalaria glabrata]